MDIIRKTSSGTVENEKHNNTEENGLMKRFDTAEEKKLVIWR